MQSALPSRVDRKPKPSSADEVADWAIEYAMVAIKGPDPGVVKLATAYLHGYADCMEGMNTESWAELQASVRSMIARFGTH